MTRGYDIKGYALEVYRDPEDGAWVAEVPDLPGCVAASLDATQLFAAAEDAIEAWIEAAEVDGRPVPSPAPMVDDYSGRFVLRVPKSLHRKLARSARRDGVSLNTFCVGALGEAVAATNSKVAQSLTSGVVTTTWGLIGRSLTGVLVEDAGTPNAKLVSTATSPQRTYGTIGGGTLFHGLDEMWPVGDDRGATVSSYVPVNAAQKDWQ